MNGPDIKIFISSHTFGYKANYSTDDTTTPSTTEL
jgi:hypothetical protein